MDKDAPFFKSLLNDYKQTRSFAQSRIRQDRISEDTTSKDYIGRELYELLQNAEDEQSDYVRIILDTNEQMLKVQNGGEHCRPFSEEGFCSIMMSGMSPKRASKEKRNYIGNKGLGFRSLLNWSDTVSIVSSGIRCSFSLDIARKYWEEIKPSLDGKLISEHEEFSKTEFNTDCPLAVFAIPEVENEDSDGFTTSIEIKLKKESYGSIQSQIDSLSGKVLLFLKHISRIEITLDGQQYPVIERSPETATDAPGLSMLTTRDKDHPEGQQWMVFHKEYDFGENQMYGIGIAYDKTGHERGDYVYTFFPTQVRIDLPCVIHATFELNSSRNSIIQSAANQEIKNKIADVLLEFAEQLAQTDNDDTTSWAYFDLLSLTDNHDFTDIAARLKEQTPDKKVYPTIGNRYAALNDTRHYSDIWADYVRHNHPEQFADHLLPEFEKRGIQAQDIDDGFCSQVQKLSAKIIEADDHFQKRCNLIRAVTSAQPGPGTVLPLLVDDKGILIADEAHMNVGESIQDLPSEMNISYVSADLANRLIDVLAIDDTNKMRGLTKRLRPFTKVTDMDVNQVKRKIVSFTRSDMDLPGFQTLMKALFNKYCEPDKGKEYVKEIASHPDFRLMDRTGKRHFPSELVLETHSPDPLCYAEEFMLEGSLDVWKQRLGDRPPGQGIKEEDLLDFFYSALGVSSVVPMSLVPIDENANDFIEYYTTTYKPVVKSFCAYYSTKLEGDSHTVSYNRFLVPSEDFLKSYLQKHSLVQLVYLLFGDDKLVNALNDTHIHYQYRNIKSETAIIGFPQYIVSKYECLSPIRSFVVSERIYLGADDELEGALRDISSKPSLARNLILLGAKEDLAQISVEDLYIITRDLPAKNLTQGVQRLYKALREALLKCEKQDPHSFETARDGFRKDGLLYARKKGILEPFPANEVYYWDNDQLPKQLLADLPKLEIGSRVGEDSVQKVFGVRLAKELLDIKLDRAASPEAADLSATLNKYFNERIRFILAYRILNTKEDSRAVKSFADNLKDTSFKVYNDCSFTYRGTTVQLQDGEMISTKDAQGTTFHIRTDHVDFKTAITDPRFCENITESICIVLKVSGSEITNCFRSIISHPIEYTRFISDKDISEDDWKKADAALGISEREKEFWRSVFELAGKDFNPESISTGRTEKQDYLEKSLPGIVLPVPLKDVEDMSPVEKYNLMISLRSLVPDVQATLLGDHALKDYYSAWVMDRISGLAKVFNCWAYDNMPTPEGDQLLPYLYFDECTRFAGGEWAMKFVEVNSARILNPEELESQLLETALAQFKDFNPKHPVREMGMRAEYKAVLDEYKLTSANIEPRVLSLALFEGEDYLEIFRAIVKDVASNGSGNADVCDSPQNKENLTISYGDAKTVAPMIVQQESKSGRKTGGRYKSDRELFQLGLTAERRVLQAMQGDPRYSEVIGCSRNLDPITGDDNKHYDIQYKKNGEDQSRYLEVKAMGNGSIIMSSAEYDFALEHRSRYDLALVDGNRITIIETPFLQTESHQALQVFPDSYKVPLEIVPRN